MTLQPGQRLGAITGVIHLEVVGEQARQGEAQAPVVLDHEDGFGGGIGRLHDVSSARWESAPF